MEPRSLYECSNAKVKDDIIYCSQAHKFSAGQKNGSISVKRLVRGEPLVVRECQRCLEFDCAGPPVPKAERGWMNRMSTSVI